MTPMAPLGKRKRPVYAESSSEDDAPLASSPVKAKSVTVSMPGAFSATTLPASAVNGNGRKKRADSDADADDDSDLKKKRKRLSNGKAKAPAKKKVKKEVDSGTESQDDEPIPVKKATSKRRKVKEESDNDVESEDDKPAKKKPAKKVAEKKVKEDSDADIESEDDKPAKKKPAKKAAEKKVKAKKEEDDASETPKAKKRGKVKKEVEASPKKGKAKKAKEEEEEEVYKWWEMEDPNGDGTEKWKTLVHNGVIFPPPYDPLPKHVKMKYNGMHFWAWSTCVTSSHRCASGKPVDLPPASEEVAGFYAAMIETDHAQDKTFNKNFFEDWKKVLHDHPPVRSSILFHVVSGLSDMYW